MDSTLAPAYQALPSLVYLRAQIPARHPSAALLGEERLGSGVASGPGVVVTAHYLVLGARQIHLEGADGQVRTVKHTVIDHESGLAVLVLEGPPLRPAPVADGAARPGTPVFMLTCTGEREWKGATGHVTQVGPFEAYWEYMLDGAIMTTAVNPGLAGAPLFDARGRTLGVVTLGLAAVARYSLAIPFDLYLRKRDEMDNGRLPPLGYAWIGIYPQPQDGGIALTGVVPGGPGEKAGLERGDLILSVDGQAVSTLRELYDAIRRRLPGDSLSFQVLRESAIRVVEVTGGDREALLPMILKVARIGHPVIRRPARDLTREELRSPDLQRLVDDMTETMHEYDGVGLAGPQVHLGLRIAVIEVPGSDERSIAAVPLTVIINPRLTPLGEETVDLWEGCLSIPELRGVVPRYRRLRLEALDRRAKPFTVEAEDFFARVIQHECDHLDGGVYLDRMRDMRTLSFLPEFERFVQHAQEEEEEEDGG